MIYTITLNPAIDKAVTIDRFKVDEVNRISKVHQDPGGGKGINVSKMIHNLHGTSTAIYIAGGHTGRMLTEMVKDMGLTYKVVVCEGETRVNIKVCDPYKNTFTDINEPGPTIELENLEVIDNYLENVLCSNDVLVLAGSLPKGVPTDIYRRWSDMARIKGGVKVIMDAYGEVLVNGIKGKPFIVKPNQEELESFFDVKFTEDDHVIYYAKRLLDMGVSYVIVSQGGADGCMLISKDAVAKIPPIVVDVKSTVGAGDSMVAAIAHGVEEILSDDEILDLRA